MKRAFAIRHVAFEDLGTISRQLAERGYSTVYVEAGVDDLSSIKPDTDDLLVVLGGPIGAYEEDRYPFLADELRVIEACIRRGTALIGICLGAQLFARALGSRVYPGPGKEIGYAPIALTEEGRASCLAPLAAADFNVLHWHGDTFDLPPGAALLASTPLTRNQAFSIGRHVLALQFHLEADPARLEHWLIGHASELGTAGIDTRTLRAQRDRVGASVAAAGADCLAAWLDDLAPAGGAIDAGRHR
ncbi:MAG: glutamine amidotransferase [Hyphomicrobiaceae bacterium]|nr:MAG: glutamine amidotransferase [Hyphomicrobiaceae bacterium]